MIDFDDLEIIKMMNSAKRFGNIENYSIYVINGKMGLKGSPNGEHEQVVLTQAIYDMIYPFVNGFSVVKKGKYYGVINKFGDETITTNKYVYLHYVPKSIGVSDYLCAKDENGKNYNLDTNGNLIIIKDPDGYLKQKIANIENIDYNKILFFRISKGLFLFEYEGKVNVYNPVLNKVIFRGKKARIINESDKVIVAQDGYSNKYGILDEEGNILTPFEYDEILGGSTGDIGIPDGLFDAKKDGKSGYINYKGRIIVPFNYKFCGTFINGFAWVSNEKGKCGLIDNKGNIVEPLIHDHIRQLDVFTIFVDRVSYSYERYSLKGYPFNYVNQSPNHMQFEFNICSFPQYVLVTSNKYKKGITRINGDVIIPVEYEELKVVNHYPPNLPKAILARRMNKWGIINMENRMVLSFSYDYITTIDGEKRGRMTLPWYKVSQGDKVGIIDDKYNICLPVIYDGIDYSKKYNCYVVRIGDKKAMVDFWNNIIVPFTSEDLLPY